MISSDDVGWRMAALVDDAGSIATVAFTIELVPWT